MGEFFVRVRIALIALFVISIFPGVALAATDPDGKPVPAKKRQWYDTYPVGYWDGQSTGSSSITATFSITRITA